MFNSTVLDLATGLVFCFLTASLATGTIVEAISSALKWRAKTLRDGIGQLLNDPDLRGLAGQLYAHAAINPRGPGDTQPEKNRPTYIDPQLFANAMMDITGISFQVAAAAGGAAGPAPGRPSLAALHTQVAAAFQPMPNPQFQQLLTGILDRSFGDVEKIQTELSTWFARAMDRVSGAYKRWTQLVGFVVALILAATLNIDAIGVAKTLWLQPTLAEKLMADQKETETDAIADLSQKLPVGWPNGIGQKIAAGQRICFTVGDWGLAFLGWLITAFSTLFGAPFWFDMLQTFIRLKGSGPSPQEKGAGKGASV
jgi:hypothetical protein